MMDTSLNKIKEQKTFVMIKPDGVRRNLVGDIITRFEQRQLKIIALKMIRPSEQDLNNHYPINDPTWVERLGHKSLTTFKDTNLDPKQHLGTNDPKEIGKSVVQRLISYMKDEPVVCMVVYGPNAILMARKIVGSTIPFHADIWSIRGDYSIDSPLIANIEGRAIHNLIHASETPEEAANEIKLRFEDHEIINNI